MVQSFLILLCRVVLKLNETEIWSVIIANLRGNKNCDHFRTDSTMATASFSTQA